MAKPKITPTTNDKVEAKGAADVPTQPKITAAHEPLSTGEGWNPTTTLIPMQFLNIGQTNGQMQMQTVMTPVQGPIPVVQPQILKVALVGTAPSSRMMAPFSDPTWTIWGCSPGNQNILPRVDAWFEIHKNLLWPEHKSYGEPYIEWLKKQKFPIYMQDQSMVPNARIFPKDELVKMFGRDFFTSSFAWMMAFAIYSGAKEIGLFGIDMASRDEYILQRPGFYFFKHMAETRGIKVSAPNESDIMMSPGLYGWSDVTPFGRKLAARKVELQSRLNQLRPQRDQISQNITYLEGALEDIDYMQSIWLGVQDNSSV